VLEEDGTVVRKTFHDGAAEELAAAELTRLERFAAALESVEGATCPQPLGRVDDPPGFRMRFVEGASFLAVLGVAPIDDAQLAAYAGVMAAALDAYVDAVGEPYRDFKLDNVLLDESEALVFLDVGDPQDAGEPAPGDSPYEISVGNFVASLVFESARPRGLLAQRTAHQRSSRLAVLLAQELRARGRELRADRLAAAARRDYVRSTFGRRSPARTVWYGTVGLAAGCRVPLPGAPVGPVAPWAARS
jgi:hypothetical protein